MRLQHSVIELRAYIELPNTPPLSELMVRALSAVLPTTDTDRSGNIGACAHYFCVIDKYK